MSQTVEYDSPWKEAIRLFLRSFLRLCFPEVERVIDWSRKPEFLDKELQQIARDAATGKQFVDVLVKVWLLNGSEEWFLLHFEVQHRPEEGFVERLFQYFCALHALYRRRVSTLVILADTDPSWRPTRFEMVSPGTRLQFDFSTCKLLDLTQDIERLAETREPAAVVVLANWAVQQAGKDDERRLALKWDLTRRLYELGFGKAEILELYRLIDWLLKLPRQMEARFRQQLMEFEQKQVMPYITSIEQFGIEKGLEEGREEGKLLTLRENVLDLLETRHQVVPYEVRERINSETDMAKLKVLLRQAASCAGIEDFKI